MVYRLRYASMLDGRQLAIFHVAGLTTNILAQDVEGVPNHKARIEIHHKGQDSRREHN